MLESLEGDQLQGLLEQEIHFLEEMLTCSKIMKGLNYEEHEVEYINLLNTRQQCLEALISIENILKAQVDVNVNLNNNLNGSDFFQEISALKTTAQKLVHEILELDSQNKAAMLEESVQIKNKIQALGRGKKGIAGYDAPQRMNVNGVFTDSRK